MGPDYEAMLGTQIQKIHWTKWGKREKIMGKPPPQITMHKIKNDKEQKTVAKQPCPSLQEDFTTMQVCALWRFSWRCRCLHVSDEVCASLIFAHISTLYSCNE